MSYLEMAKQAAARLSAEAAGYAINAENDQRPAPPVGGPVAEALPFLAMPLDEFQAHGALLEVRVPWLPVTLWIVPTERDITVLMTEGISRGRIWTAAELMNLMAITDRTAAAVKTITHAKLEMNGEITEVRCHGHLGGTTA